MKMQDMKTQDMKLQDMKLRDMKMQDVKMQDVKNRRHETIIVYLLCMGASSQRFNLM